MAKKKKTNTKKSNAAGGDGGAAGIMVDPARIRFQHARIRPYFSGCGRSVQETLEEIRQGKIQASDLPPIQVLVGSGEEPWYFSLNNRRLWVLKRCREEGLLRDNKILVRVRKPKSDQEAQRYTVENCALEAKIMSEKPKNAVKETVAEDAETTAGNTEHGVDNVIMDDLNSNVGKQLSLQEGQEEESEDSESSDDEAVSSSNRFSALF